ncbi:lipid IV(A) 3-deoxy-D-manno-octulosonic acid transferase [Azonexus sp.]|uniref:lipid IV(A) 3-deoxy-D-manno-octulosonic acid transferase n=1 Tax=Azonexus sp. TaxID=1872668 RepID=UPI0039E3F742
MPRRLYSLILYLATPLILLRLFWRARKQAAYREHLGERFGFYPALAQALTQAKTPPGRKPLIWLHAVSVGETRAAEPLLHALSERWPDHQILITGMTPTGRETAHQLYGERVLQAYLPYDFPDAVARFFRHFQPRFGVLMETEIWPNLLAAAADRSIPIALANARLSERSARGYQRFSALSSPAFAQLSAVAAQTAADAERLRSLGAKAVTVCGNLKFDVRPQASLLTLGATWREERQKRPAWLAASTREGEEALLLDAWQKKPSAALLILVPRHPQRFSEIAQLLRARGLNWRARSAGLPTPETQVWLGDSMGEMAAYYTCADLAFIGGSLLPLGGQNLIEAAACACPVLLGPHTFNFLQASEDAIAAGCARRVQDADAVLQTVEELFADASTLTRMRERSLAFAAAHQGASERTLALLQEISAPAPDQARH